MLYAIIILSILVVILLLCIGVLLYGMKNNKKTLDGILGNDDVTEEEIISMVNEGNEQGLIHDDEVEMITNIFEFSEKEVRDVMTPRSDVVGIDKHTTMDETIKIMLENNYSRYPVFDDDLDNIVGILYFKDFVKAYLKDKNQTIEQIMVEPIFVHPTKNISELFKRMQKEKIHMVIVVDEYGQTEGIIAMEDILEEIVGNIFDEYDDDDDDIALAGHGYIVGGRAELDELSEHLGIEFPDEDFQTLNGFMLYELGRLPYENEKIDITYKGYNFETIGIKDKMIDKVRITKVENENQV